MPCYYPHDVWRKHGGGITFNRQEGFVDRPLRIACGQCHGCRLERSRQWAMRCVHEASLYERNCFLTLTYNDESLQKLSRSIDRETGEIGTGSGYSLNKRDIQLFLKRLRKRYGEGIRFFQCGEYGETKFRPHHHMLLFNLDFPDRVLWKVRDGVRLYYSPSLTEPYYDNRGVLQEPLWPHGFVVIGDVTFESAAYVARYIMKKWNGDKADYYYAGLEPEFITMSRRPGIGREWFEKFKGDVYPADRVVMRDKVLRPPKYYDKIYDLQDPNEYAKIKARRVVTAKNSPDNTVDRLMVRERLARKKIERLVRTID